jgi:hypothetical protein
MSTKFPIYDPSWNSHFNVIDTVEKITHIENGEKIYSFKLKYVKYIANDHNVIAYELYTNLNPCHYFRHVQDEVSICGDYHVICGINANNTVVNSLLECIMYDKKILSANSGMEQSESYRSRLIKILVDLWD